MGLTELFILAVGLSWMARFAVAVCKDLLCRKSPGKRLPQIGLWFGGFRLLCLQQATFSASGLKTATAIDHWIAFMLLSIIGINMIREAFSGDEESSNDLLDCKTMFLWLLRQVLTLWP